MNASLGIAHSDDIRSLRDVGLKYVTSLQPNQKLVPSILNNSLKEDYHRWKHPVLSELLCPVDYLTEYRADPTG
jgi:replication fork clamp-binding protein CrfC